MEVHRPYAAGAPDEPLAVVEVELPLGQKIPDLVGDGLDRPRANPLKLTLWRTR